LRARKLDAKYAWVKGPPKRIHPSGRLAFRSNVREAKASDLPLRLANKDTPLPWQEILPPGEGPLELEIGCGKGTFILEAARRHPERRFLGIEAGPPYATYCADRLARHGLHNAFMVADDARVFLEDTAPEGVFSRIHVYYPDPWPKRRHRQRRFFQPETLPALRKALSNSGELLIATDNTRLFGEILAALGESPLFCRSKKKELIYGIEIPGTAFGPTNFSKKYQKQGKPTHRAVFLTNHPIQIPAHD
jgi:tRNA (guanine-N7-)-methyltransferase